jgi:chaperonin cofactor prefoldin
LAETVATGIVGRILAEYVKKVAEKALAGKKLSDWEVGILMMNQMGSSLEARINSLEKSLEAKINSLDDRIGSIDEKYDARISSLEERLEARIGSLEKRIEKIELDMDYLKKSLDSLRDNVVNVLVAELRTRREKE